MQQQSRSTVPWKTDSYNPAASAWAYLHALRLPSFATGGLLRRHWFSLLLLAVLGAVLAERWAVVAGVAALGNDAGSYLATMRQLLGHDVTGEGLLRPPFVGVLLWPLTQLLGPIDATKLLAILAATAPAVIFYLLASRHVSRGVALAAAVPFVFSTGYVAAMSWGFLTLIGVSMYGLAFLLVRDVVLTGSRKAILALAGIAWLLAFTNQISLTLFVLSALGAGLVVIAHPALRPRWRSLAASGALAALLALPLAPIYLHQSSSLGSERFFSLHLPWQHLDRFVANVEYLFPVEPLFPFVVLGTAAAAGAAVLALRSARDFATVVAPALVLLLIAMAVTGAVGDRSILFLYLWLWIFVAVAVDALLRGMDVGRWKAAGAISLVLLAIAYSGYSWIRSGLWLEREAAEWYGYMTEDRLDAITAVDRRTPPGPGVAYPRGLGWWIEGVAARRVFESDRAGVYTRSDRSRNTVLANAVLAGETVTYNGAVFVSDAYTAPELGMDPSIGIDNGEFKHLVYLDDSRIALKLDGDASSRPLAAGPTTDAGPSKPVDRRRYDLGEVGIVKSVTVEEGSAVVSVAFELQGDARGLDRVEVPVLAARDPSLIYAEADVAAFQFFGSSHLEGNWQGTVVIHLEAAPGSEARFEEDPANHGVVAVVSATPGGGGEFLKLLFEVRGEPIGEAGAVGSLYAADILRDLGATFIAVDSNPPNSQHGDPIGRLSEAWLERFPLLDRVPVQSDVLVYSVAGDTARTDEAP